MTSRDLFWRAIGSAMIGAGYVATHSNTAATAIVGPTGLLVAAAGLLLMLGGKRIPLALRVERSRHRHLPTAIRASRHDRHARR